MKTYITFISSYLRPVIYLLLAVLLFNGGVSYAQEEEYEKEVGLKGLWRFSIGDNMEWAKPGYDDSDWEMINAPSSWENEGFYGYNGYAWYRKSFTISKWSENRTLYIQLGYIDDVDEVYVNGNLVGRTGSFPPKYTTAYNAFRMYPIPPDYINYGGQNLVAVRVFDSEITGGIISGELGIYSYKNVLDAEILLEGTWKFKLGDNKQWKEPGFDDDTWDDIMVPGRWEVQGYDDYNGFAWYRKEFYVRGDILNENLVVVLGKIDDLDEAYLNGKRIGSTGRMRDDPFDMQFSHEWQEMRGYFVNKDMFNANGNNVLAVRVYDGYLDGGIYQGPLGIVKQSKYTTYWRERKQKEKSFWDNLFKSLDVKID